MIHTVRNLLASFLATAAVAMAPSALAATVIDTESAWNRSASVSSWGIPDTRVYGQSITAPVGASALTGFSFNIRDTAVAVPYSAFMYAWNGNQITGGALFSAAGQPFGGTSTGNFLRVAFSTTVLVTPGDQYMLFLSTIGEVGGSQTQWGLVGGNSYAGGEFRYLSGDNFANLFTATWDTLGFSGGDLAFSATFDGGTTVIPVPGALALMLSGAGMLGLLSRRRRS